MKLVRYGNPGKEKPGLIDAERPAARPERRRQRHRPGAARRCGAGEAAQAQDRQAAAGARHSRASAARSPSVGKFIAIGLNYADHAAESGLPIPEEPVVFMKATSCIQGPNDPVMLPKGSVKTDWEVELGVVIGTRARYVSQEGRARLRGRLLHHQRRQRARIPDRARRHLGQGQGLRHLRPDRPLAGDARRGRRIRRSSTCGST